MGQGKGKLTPARALRTKGRHPNPSGHQASYHIGDGLTRSGYKCACHGQEFETRAIMRMHIKQYRHMVRTSLAEMVKLGNLGQNAWERLPGETPLQHRRFMAYLTTVGPNFTRSVDRAAAVMGASPRSISRQSTLWSWVVRADLFDRHIEAEEFRQFEASKRQSARRQATLGKSLQDAALAGARSLLADPDRISEMSGHEISKLADAGVKIERLANSDPTAISEDRGQVRLVWEGPRPTWAPDPPALKSAHPPEIEGRAAGDQDA